MSDYQLRARIPHEIADAVKEIANELNEIFPEGEFTISTIARHALKDYVARYQKKSSAVVIDPLIIPYKELDDDHINEAINALSALLPLVENKKEVKNGLENFKRELETREIYKLIEQRRLKKTNS